jgi:phosphatidylglycerophosphate synthase
MSEVQYFIVDFLGKITREVATSDGRPVKNMAAPSPDGLHLLEIEALTGASVNETTVTLLEIREAQAPPLPENTQLVGQALEFTPSGTVFDKPIKLTLGYNVSDLPEGVISVGAAYYTSQDGWVYLDTQSTSVAELGKLTASLNHFTIFAVLAKVTPPQPSLIPAQFNLNNLSITTSVHRIFEKITYIIRTGEDAFISADVTNNGVQTGTYTAILMINGTERGRKDITLETGQTSTVSFTVTGNERGTYTVVIGTLSGEFVSDLWINWWLIVATIALIILIIWLIRYIIKRRKQAEGPTINQ